VEEIFLNLERNNYFSDVMRITPGLGNKINDKWRAELNVSYHNVKEDIEDSFQNNNIVFRLRVFTSFKYILFNRIYLKLYFIHISRYLVFLQ